MIVAENISVIKLRMAFLSFIFAPVVLSFILPLVGYNQPFSIRTAAGVIPFTPQDISRAILVFLVWIGLFVGIFLLPFTRANVMVRYDWTAERNERAFIWFASVGSVVSVLHYLIEFPSSIEAVVHLLSYLPVVAFPLGILILRDRPNQKVKVLALMLASLIAILFPFAVTKVAPVLFNVMAIWFSMHYIRVAFRWQAAVVVVLLGLVAAMLPVKTYLRTVMFGGMHERVSVLSFFEENKSVPTSEERPHAPEKKTNSEVLFSADRSEFEVYDPNFYSIRALGLIPENGILHYSLARILNRTNHLGELALVVRTTPNEHPYSGLHTYVPLAGKPIPRFFWGAKPNEVSGQYFGHRYRFLEGYDLTTSVNLPIIVEGWMAGGWVGVCLSSLFFALILRAIWERWICIAGGPGNMMLGVVVVVSTVNQESNFSLIVGGLFYGLIVFVPLSLLLQRVNWKK